MAKLTAGLVVFAVGAALVLGLLATGAAVKSSPAVLAALAEQEQARAEQIAAEADEARAQAAGAWAWVDAARAVAAAVGDWAGWFVFVGLLAFAVLSVGLALAIAGWARSRARFRVIRTDSGPVLAYSAAGRLVVVDTARSLGGVTVLDELSGAVSVPMLASEDTAAHVASQALAAGVIARVAGQGGPVGADMVERIGAGLHAVMGSLSLPGFRVETESVPMSSTAAPGPALRYMKVRAPEDRNREAAELDAHDLRHFITEGQTHGYGRAYWVGRTLATGRRCTRSRWQWLAGALDAAGLMADGPNNTRVLAVPVAEAYDRLSLGAVEAGQAG